MSSSADALPAPPTAHRSRPVGVPLVRAAVWLACAALILVPFATVLTVALRGDNLAELLTPQLRQGAINSLVSATLSGIGAVVLGAAFAVLFERTDVPGRRAARLFALSPMLVPPFVGAIAWIGVAGPVSPVNRWWTGLTGSPLWNIYGGDGVVFLLIVHSYPIAMLIVGAALRRTPADLEQAARIAGASAPRALLTVTVPLLRPALLSSFTLIVVSNLADFGIPAIVGLPERYATLSTLVYRYLASATVPDPLGVVASIGSALLLLALLALIADALLARRGAELDVSASTAQLLPLGRLRAVVAVLSWVVVLALTLLPVLALATTSLLPAPGVPLAPENITLDNLVRALTSDVAITGARTSIVLAGLAALACSVLGLVIGVLVTRTRARGNRALHATAVLPQAIPGLVIAVAWLVLAPRLGLFNTPWLILLAYVTSFLALVVQAVHAPLSATPLAAEEAARVAGARPLRAMVNVSLRMALPAAIAGGVLVLLTAARELTVSVLLLAPGAQTLGVAIFNLQQAGDYNAAAALSLVVALVGLAGLGLAARSPQ